MDNVCIGYGTLIFSSITAIVYGDLLTLILLCALPFPAILSGDFMLMVIFRSPWSLADGEICARGEEDNIKSSNAIPNIMQFQTHAKRTETLKQGAQTVKPGGGGGGGHFHIYMHIRYVPRERPTFSALNFRSRAYHFYKWFYIPDHHHFQNFFTFKPFIATHGRHTAASPNTLRSGSAPELAAGQSASQTRLTKAV